MIKLSENVREKYNTDLAWTRPGNKVGFRKISAKNNNLMVGIYLPKVRGREHFVKDMEKGDVRSGESAKGILIPTPFFKSAFPRLFVSKRRNKRIKAMARRILKNRAKYRVFVRDDKVFMAGWVNGKFSRRKVRGNKRRVLNRETRPIL